MDGHDSDEIKRLLKAFRDVDNIDNDQVKTNAVLAGMEALRIDVDSAYPWPSTLSQLMRTAHRILAAIPNSQTDTFRLRARLESLERTWDRLQIVAVGTAWSRKLSTGRPVEVPLPVEVIFEILSSHVPDTHEDHDKAWREQTDFLLSCALVAKNWNLAATDPLYSGQIRLATAVSVKYLVRTLDGISPRRIRHVSLTAPLTTITAEVADYKGAAVRLLVHSSPTLEILEITDWLHILNFSRFSFRQFPCLRDIRLGGGNLRQLAGILTKCPKLKELRLDGVLNVTGHNLGVTSIAEPAGDSLSDIPRPTYDLRELYMKRTALAAEQVEWLLSGSNLTVLSVNTTNSPALPHICGSFVTRLHLEMRDTSVFTGWLAGLPSDFPLLTHLRIMGAEWPWAVIFQNLVHCSLTEITISWSDDGFHALVRALGDSSWQPSLRKITVIFEEHTQWQPIEAAAMIKMQAVSKELEALSQSRGISILWFPPQRVGDKYSIFDLDPPEWATLV
ncbi:hypothetical protein C8R44DRAFT_50376 [Mycena epipterygia]|nr:hypothetical protein C8R44DRAFT_50376 [Mycena epipterygia]